MTARVTNGIDVMEALVFRSAAPQKIGGSTHVDRTTPRLSPTTMVARVYAATAPSCDP
jgi:hypothetical protein